MSWIDRIENVVFTIRTGDGQLFYPDWKNGETTKEFNNTIFDFINQPGSLIDRKKVKARKFPLTFYFQGENNIDEADAFDEAANDPRAWTVRHPFYGDITGQPISLSRNDTSYNCTEITVELYETIVTDFPVAVLDPIAKVMEKIVEYQEDSSTDYANNVNLKPADVAQIKTTTDKINSLISKAMDTAHYAEYQQLSATAFNAIDNAISDPYDAMFAIQSLLLIPSQLNTSIIFRVNLISAIYGAYIDELTLNKSQSTKAHFEAAAGFVVATLANALLNPLFGNYQSMASVVQVIAALINQYNNYLISTNAGYVSINTPTTTYSPAYSTQTALQNVVLQAISGLNVIAFNSKRERFVVLGRDSNLIVLTNKYMGLDPLDVNIETFRTINNIKNNSLFLIPKGTTIVYYV